MGTKHGLFPYENTLRVLENKGYGKYFNLRHSKHWKTKCIMRSFIKYTLRLFFFFFGIYGLGPLACSNSELTSRFVNRIDQWYSTWGTRTHLKGYVKFRKILFHDIHNN
jgi:hypothetical protein